MRPDLVLCYFSLLDFGQLLLTLLIASLLVVEPCAWVSMQRRTPKFPSTHVVPSAGRRRRSRKLTFSLSWPGFLRRALWLSLGASALFRQLSYASRLLPTKRRRRRKRSFRNCMLQESAHVLWIPFVVLQAFADAPPLRLAFLSVFRHALSFPARCDLRLLAFPWHASEAFVLPPCASAVALSSVSSSTLRELSSLPRTALLFAPLRVHVRPGDPQAFGRPVLHALPIMAKARGYCGDIPSMLQARNTMANKNQRTARRFCRRAASCCASRSRSRSILICSKCCCWACHVDTGDNACGRRVRTLSWQSARAMV